MPKQTFRRSLVSKNSSCELRRRVCHLVAIANQDTGTGRHLKLSGLYKNTVWGLMIFFVAIPKYQHKLCRIGSWRGLKWISKFRSERHEAGENLQFSSPSPKLHCVKYWKEINFRKKWDLPLWLPIWVSTVLPNSAVGPLRWRSFMSWTKFFVCRWSRRKTLTSRRITDQLKTTENII